MSDARSEDEEPRAVHEAHGVKFYIVGGCVEGRRKADGCKLPDGLLPSLLLLDIAQTLLEIKRWGIAQESEVGQPVYDRH